MDNGEQAKQKDRNEHGQSQSVENSSTQVLQIYHDP